MKSHYFRATHKSTASQALIGKLVSVLVVLSMPLSFQPQRTAAEMPAATGGITIAVNGCDSSNYPDISCIVTPVNSAGVPLQNLDATSFQVVDGSATFADIQVQRVISPDLKASVLLMVDFGMIRQGEALQPLKDSSTSILQAASVNDRLAVVALTGPVNVNTTLNPATDHGFAPAAEKRNEMINLIKQLSAVGHTPLFDAVCKSLMLTAQENVGRRAVIVLSDGRDVGSVACADADTISRASKERIPVFTIGVGPDLKEDYLRQLASDTGGQYESALQLQNVLEIFKRMELNLRTQYQVTFHMTVPGDGQGRTVDIRVTQGGNTASEKASFVTATPIKPTFTKVTFTIDGEVVNPKMLPANKTAIVEPKIESSKSVKSVEYIVAGVSTKETTPPFQFVVATNDLNGVNKITLKTAGEEGNPASVTSYDVQVGIDPASLVQIPTTTPKPTLLQQLTTFPGILVVFVLAALLILVILLIVLLARRQAQKNQRYIPQSSPTMVTPVVQPEAGSNEPQSAAVQGAFATQIFSEPSAQSTQPPSGATIMFSPALAILEITSGESVGKRFNIGGTGLETLTIGREPDIGAGAVKIVSQFVSRKHARINVEAGVIYVTDLGSSSGTRLNGEKLIAAQRRVIKVGDKIDFADVSAQIGQV